MVLGQHRRMWLEAMRQTEQRVYGFGSLKDGYALVGIHLRKQKCCLKKGTTSVTDCLLRRNSWKMYLIRYFYRPRHTRGFHSSRERIS